jgi:predicted O-methyltransferase YrrM
MTIKAVLRRVLPQSAANFYRRQEERRWLRRIPKARFDMQNLATDAPHVVFPSESEWAAIERRVAFGRARASAVNTGDQRLIYCLTRSLMPHNVLEIGTNVGGSTAMFSAALGSAGHVTTVDIVDVNGPEGPARKLGCETPAELIQMMGLNNVTFVKGHSLDFLRTCNERFELIFLDGAHEADIVYQEVVLALGLLKANGMILLHDYFPDLKPLWSDGKVIPGPWLAIRRLKREGAPLRVEPFGELPWKTKYGSNATSLALLLRTRP